MESRPVFVADHPWRGRAVKGAIAAGGMLLLAWLVAIVIGGLGFGSLPAVPFSGGADDDGAGSPHGFQGGAASSKGSQAAPDQAAKTSSSDSGESSDQPNGSKDQASKGTGGSLNSGGATAAPTQPASTIPGSTQSSGKGRGAQAIQPTGGRGSLEITPSGKVPGINSGGANPNGSGASAGGYGSGSGRPTY